MTPLPLSTKSEDYREFTEELITTCISLHSAPSWEPYNLPSSRGFFHAAVPDPTTPRQLVTLSQQHLSDNSDISNMEEANALAWIYFSFLVLIVGLL